MAEKVECWIYVAMNEDGDYVAHEDSDAVLDVLAENFGGANRRVVKIKVLMSPPVVEEGPTVEVPDEAGNIDSVEAEAA